MVVMRFIVSMIVRLLILGPHEACSFTILLCGKFWIDHVYTHVVADHFTLSVATVVMTFMSTHAQDVEFNTGWKSKTVVAFFFNVEANERNTFFVLVTHHFHDFAKFLHADVAILVSIVHCEHHFGHVVIVIFVVCFVFTMVMVIMIVFVRHHHFHHL